MVNALYGNLRRKEGPTLRWSTDREEFLPRIAAVSLVGGLVLVPVIAVILLSKPRAETAELPRPAIVELAIAQALTEQPGDPVRGLRITLDRAKGNCVPCHEIPLAVDFPGNLGPPLSGVGERYSAGELRLRLVDSKLINPESNMPPYYRVAGLTAVRSAFAGRPILTAQEIEDVIAYLQTLR